MSDLGIGLCPMGLAPFGYGAPTRLNSTTAKLFIGASNIKRNAPGINTITGDAVRDPTTGIHRGMDSVQQMVYLALRTLRGSAVVKSLGIAMKVKTISETTAQKVRDEVTIALADLVSRTLVRVDKIEVTRIKPTAIEILVRWTNLTNNESNLDRWTNV